MFQRNGRFYADFRAYADVGGERGALAEPGGSWGTTDREIADTLFATKLAELQRSAVGGSGPLRRPGLPRWTFWCGTISSPSGGPDARLTPT